MSHLVQLDAIGLNLRHVVAWEYDPNAGRLLALLAHPYLNSDRFGVVNGVLRVVGNEARDLAAHLRWLASPACGPAPDPASRAHRLVAQGVLTPAEADRWADPEVMSRDLADLDESC